MSTILVIDDDEQILNYLWFVLESAGHDVLRAHNGAKGAKAYRATPTDLVLCDLFMDRQEGLETIRQFQKEFPMAKVIAMSGGSKIVPGDYLYHAAVFGASACLQKPLERQSLLQTVRNVLA